MKYIKFFEDKDDDLHESLSHKVIDIIDNDNKVINGFKVDYDRMSGTIEWFNDDYIFYATPYWENNKKLPINSMTVDGDEIYYETIKLGTLKNDDDVAEVIEFYYEKIGKVTSLLNKRTELRNVIEILLKSVGNIFLKKYNFNLNVIDVNQIPDSDINDLLVLFNNEYPDILQSVKFNL